MLSSLQFKASRLRFEATLLSDRTAFFNEVIFKNSKLGSHSVQVGYGRKFCCLYLVVKFLVSPCKNTVESRISGIFGHSEIFHYCEIFHYFGCSFYTINNKLVIQRFSTILRSTNTRFYCIWCDGVLCTIKSVIIKKAPLSVRLRDFDIATYSRTLV